VALFLAFGIEWAAISFLGRASSPTEAQTWLRLGRLGPLINGPRSCVILSGGYLASLTGAMKQGGFPRPSLHRRRRATGIAINVPFSRKIRLASSKAAKNSYAPSAANPAVSVRLRVFLALGIIFLMLASCPLRKAC